MDRPSTPSRMGLASAMPGTARPGSAFRGLSGFQTGKQQLPPTTASSGATSGVGIGVALDTQVQVSGLDVQNDLVVRSESIVNKWLTLLYVFLRYKIDRSLNKEWWACSLASVWAQPVRCMTNLFSCPS